MARRVSFLLFNEVDQSYQVYYNLSDGGLPIKFVETVTESSTDTTQNVKRKSILKDASRLVERTEPVNLEYDTTNNDKYIHPSNNCSTSNNTKEALHSLCCCCLYRECKTLENTRNCQQERPTTSKTSSSKRLSNIINKRRNSINHSLLRCFQVVTNDGSEDSDDGIEEITFPSYETSCSSSSSADTIVTSFASCSFINAELFENIKYIDDEDNENVQSCTEPTFEILSTSSYSGDHGIDLTGDTTPQQITSTSLDASTSNLSNYFSNASNASTFSSATLPSNNTSNTSPTINCLNLKEGCYEVTCDPSGCLVEVICTSHELHFKCPCCSAVKTMQPGLNYYYLLKHIFDEDHPHKIMQQLKNCICSSVEADKQENYETTRTKNSLPRRVTKSLVGRLRRLKQQNGSGAKISLKQCVL
ncbi:hypothetical protein HELRODRAFT_172960 [Helobdella robusta]|uniref:Uncharacterized protein n=1 Tax=Helobdella robusta TaxID=6412 RepID=T1F676_HELRO|nr:hypothetical protein HELRODRAFT_172960 [Helobdella robusta]ESO03930.1 hypothetical protein HELRODRAFT_172960 [Helobdella robusta]